MLVALLFKTMNLSDPQDIYNTLRYISLKFNYFHAPSSQAVKFLVSHCSLLEIGYKLHSFENGHPFVLINSSEKERLQLESDKLNES